MKIEIWSDVMCPFCYIGKRRFENALNQFADKDKIEVEWKSFQLDPYIITDASKTVNDYLAERKGIPVDQAKEMNAYVTNMAAGEGLTYNFDKAVVANSFDAHRFSHLAKKHGLQDEAEEALFKAYFTEGKNTADRDTLAELGTQIGLDSDEVKSTLATNAYAEAVNHDVYEARQIGVQGVPFFVLDRKYAISGAQSSAVFSSALNQAWQEYKTAHPELNMVVGDGEYCTPESC